MLKINQVEQESYDILNKIKKIEDERIRREKFYSE